MAYAVTPRPHIVRVPRHMILLRILQLLNAAILLAVTAYGVHVLSAPGIILALVTGRPYNPSYHSEDFVTTTHGNTTNSTDVFSATTFLDSTNGTVAGNFSIVGEGTSVNGSLIPKFTGVQISAPAVTQALAPQILDTRAQVSGPPRLASEVSKREITRGNFFPDILIPFSEMDLKKLCYHPANLGALESAYPPHPSPTQSAPSMPSTISDWHEGLRGSEYLTLTGSIHSVSRLVKRVFDNFREDFRANYQYFQAKDAKGKGFRDIMKEVARETWTRRTKGLNDWGSPVKNAMLLPPHWLMTGHLQTASLSILHLALVLLTTHCPSFAPYYNWPLLLIFEFLMLVLWILSFCVLGAQVSLASAIGYGTTCGEDGYCYTYASWDKRKHFLQLMTSAAVHSGIMSILYLISVSMFTASVLKHRREGGVRKPLDPAKSHPGPFSVDEGDNGEEATNSATDEEAGKHGRRKSYAERHASKKAGKELTRFEKAAAKKDKRAIKNMKKGGMPKEPKPTVLPSSGGIFEPTNCDGAEEPTQGDGAAERRRSRKRQRQLKNYRLSLHGFEMRQMRKAMEEVDPQPEPEPEPAQDAPYQRGN